MFLYLVIGPPVTVTEEFGWKDCEVKVKSIGSPFVSSAVCKDDQLHEVVPADRNNHVYYLTIPIKRSHRVMSRWYQYLLADINVALKHDYIKQTHGKTPTKLHPLYRLIRQRYVYRI